MTKDSPTSLSVGTNVLQSPIANDLARVAMMRDDLVAALTNANLPCPDDRSLNHLGAIMAHSSFLARLIRTRPHLIAQLASDLTGATADAPGFEAMLTASLETAQNAANADTMAAMMAQLRQAKSDLSLGLSLADLTGIWPVERVTRALSDQADASVQAAATFLLKQAQQKGDLQSNDPDNPVKGSGLIILAMGKLGAHELNYSSDIDLIVLYDGENTPYQGRKTAAEFFVALTRDLVKAIQSMTEDGYVFRTDLRLRPDSSMTPLAVPLSAAISYYESTGLNWERAAMIKARPIGGDLSLGETFLTDIRPFVWRRALDFAAIDDVQEMTTRIRRQHGQGPLDLHGHNVKLGRGGIREIEFFVQTYQMILGGRNRQFRERQTLQVLATLAEEDIISRDDQQNLAAAYIFLREVEHRLQMLNDEQTQTLPKNTEALTAFAQFCGFAGLAEFEAAFCVHDANVRLAYDALLNAGKEGKDNREVDHADDQLTALGYTDPNKAREIVDRWQTAPYRSLKSERARLLAKDLAATILTELAKADAPNLALVRFDDFLSRLPAGVQFFSLIRAHPWVLEELALLIAASPRLCRQLERRPSLLDIFIDDQLLSILDDPEEARMDLSFRLGAARSYEEQLDITRQWKSELEFLIAARHMSARLPTPAATTDLTHLADATIQTLKPLVEAEFARKHGVVSGGSLGIIAVGRLGEEQMTPQSDLDLIFVYQTNGDIGSSDGEKPLTTGLYFHRLTQRIINALGAPTAEGHLYEVDMRMRPQGKKGPIASSLESFAAYYQNDAWIFERQALCKARVIAAPDNLKVALETIIDQAVHNHNEPTGEVHAQIGMMRQRMDKAAGTTPRPTDVKLARGGLVDIEFLKQAIALTGTPPQPLNDDDTNIIEDALALYRKILMAVRSNLDPDQIRDSVLESLPAQLSKQLCAIMDLDEHDSHEARLQIITDALLAHQGAVKALFDRQFSGLTDTNPNDGPPVDDMPAL